MNLLKLSWGYQNFRLVEVFNFYFYLTLFVSHYVEFLGQEKRYQIVNQLVEYGTIIFRKYHSRSRIFKFFSSQCDHHIFGLKWAVYIAFRGIQFLYNIPNFLLKPTY